MFLKWNEDGALPAEPTHFSLISSICGTVPRRRRGGGSLPHWTGGSLNAPRRSLFE